MRRAHRHIDRANTDSEKWRRYEGRDVLPFWVADMDLPTAPFVLRAVQERLDHPVLGYARTPQSVAHAFVDWLGRCYGWRVSEEWLVWIAGVAAGFNMAARAVAEGGTELIVPTPAYPPFFRVAQYANLRPVYSPLVLQGERWEMDFDHLSSVMSANTAAVLYSNPQNPTGRVYEKTELSGLADLIVANDSVVISDEIHCPIILDVKKRHVPIASLDAGVAARSITLFSATKAYNFPGLGGAVAVIPNAGIRERFEEAMQGFTSNISPLAYAAMGAAFADQSNWLVERNDLFARNAHLLLDAVNRMEGVRTTHVEGTFVMWLDTTALALADPAAYLESRGLGLSDGVEFGAPGFVRFNLGCDTPLLQRGIERLEAAVADLARQAS